MKAKTAFYDDGQSIAKKADQAFERWRQKPITDTRLKEIYQDIENIIREAKSNEPKRDATAFNDDMEHVPKCPEIDTGRQGRDGGGMAGPDV